jgi:hypothetical protein
VHDPSTWRSEPANELWAKAFGDGESWLPRVEQAARAVEKLSDE